MCISKSMSTLYFKGASLDSELGISESAELEVAAVQGSFLKGTLASKYT